MDCKQNDEILEQKCRQALCVEKDAVTRFKCLALKSGCNKIASISRKFNIMDDDRNKMLGLQEFIKGCNDVLRLTRGMDVRTVEEVFAVFDKDGSGGIDFNEFLTAIRPSMNEKRLAIVRKAFAHMDRTGDGVVTVDDMKDVYNAKEHPKYKNGEWTERQVFLEFLKSFQDSDDPNPQEVTENEWIDYYRGVSASIDDDAYFDLMMTKCWFTKKPAKPAERADKFW